MGRVRGEVRKGNWSSALIVFGKNWGNQERWRAEVYETRKQK